MSIKTDVELLAQVASVIVVNGNREITPPLDASIRNNVIDSKLNIKDGGLVVQALTGYTTELTITNSKHFTHKKYVDDLVGAYLPLAGGTMTGNINFDDDSEGITWDGGSYIKEISAELVYDGDKHIFTGGGINIGQEGLYAAALNISTPSAPSQIYLYNNNTSNKSEFQVGNSDLTDSLRFQYCGSGFPTLNMEIAASAQLMAVGCPLQVGTYSNEEFSIWQNSTKAASFSGGSVNFISSLNLSYATASTLVGLDGSKNLVSLDTATYPSLTELSYVKGVTSAIQGQINDKQPLDSDLTSWASVTRASGFDTFVATPSSANLRSLLTDELGTGAAIFDGATPSAGLVLTNCTGLPTSGVTGYQGYCLEAETAQFSPADATTYYFAVLVTTVNTTDGNTALIIPKAGTLKRVDVIVTNQGTLGSNETSTISFRLNSTTDTTISSALVTNAVRGAFTATGLAVAVAVGDTFEIKWVSPSWATNPTNVRLKAILYIE